jgi:hypothetical protein
MKSIYVESLKENNLSDKEGQVLLDSIKGCSDRCCKKVLGICIKWCFECFGIPGSIGIGTVITAIGAIGK